MFSMLVPMKSRLMTFRGDMICEDIPAVVLLFFAGLEELFLDGELVATPRLDGFCLLIAGFFIEAKTGFAKRVESGHLISSQIPDFNNFMAFYYYASLNPPLQRFLLDFSVRGV